ncbi:LLM class F420-dependent oxidoreductase [Candidatus Poriferisodalis sp.]|uniref:LLM class F420-dependent oxidoreductase n=1 Tax=Candidatus Poriferisodalis sp. TaxID=3101277 RepID=UPI003B01C270
MHVGITPINSAAYLDPGYLRSFAQQLEELGYESVWTFEHVIVPHDYESRYPYNPSGKLGLPTDAGFTDPFIALTFVAGATERLRLGTGVNIVTQANALYFAKQASSLDHLSDGRLELGIGVGWLEEEFDALGVPFDRRGARADEYIDAMTAAWTGEDVDFRGEFLDWTGFSMLPTPAQRPRMPLLIGGTTPPAIRRLVARGDGWYVIHKDLDDFKRLIGEMRAECDRQGRDPAELALTAYWNYHREGLEGLEVYRDHGVQRLLINTAALRMGRPEDAVVQFADEALPACNEA